MNNICKQASQKRAISINSNPLQNRNFISISYLFKSLDYLFSNSKNLENFEIFNITSKKTLTLEELSSFISKKYDEIFNLDIILKYKKQKLFIEKMNYSSRLDSILKSDENFESELTNLIYYCENKFNYLN